MAEKAQVGDLIRIVNAEPYSYDTYKDGDILEVIGRFEVGDVVEVKETDLNGDTMFLFDSEYVIHRKAGEEYVEFDNSYAAQAERLSEDKWDEEDTAGRVYVKTVGEDDGRYITKAEYDAQFIDTTQEESQADRIKHAGTELTELLVRKNHDYGDSFAKQYEKYGLMSALIRMDDKMRRLETLLGGTDAQVDESIKDTLLDLAGYALLASVEESKCGAKRC